MAILRAEQGEPLESTFNDRWAEHSAWSSEVCFLLRLFSQWLKENALLDAAVEARISRLEHRVRTDKVMVAFVAEFSRGKSEMINAIFFADYGRRIMPASAGRTTMCPTEIGYESDLGACLRLLPIQTRLQPASLFDWRSQADAWVVSELDVNDAEQLARTMERVTDTIQVSTELAQALGFWHEQSPQTNPPLDADGLVQVPKWRHALVNISHPLLQQGLVILDTPGLNAIGAEPELTVSLIAQAQAVVFILGADTGVTHSDLAIWQHHLVTEPDLGPSPMVVLNKIDMLWDELSTTDQTESQMGRQKADVARALGMAEHQVLAVSAQKALIAKISNNEDLLAKSGIEELEAALAQGMLGQRYKLLRANVNDALTSLQLDIDRAIHIRKCDLAEQLAELSGMQGKSRAVLAQMRRRIAIEQQEFELGRSKFVAIKAVQDKLFQQIVLALDERALRQEMGLLDTALTQRGLKLGVKKVFGETFDRLRQRLRSVQSIVEEIQAMHEATFAQINIEFGFALRPIAPPSLESHLTDLSLAELNHTKYLGFRNVLRLAQTEFAQRLVGALDARLRRLCDGVLSDLDLWRKTQLGALDEQVGLRRANFVHRLETIEKVQQVAGGIDQRLSQLTERQLGVDALARKLAEQTACLIATNEDALKLDAREYA